MPNREDAEDRMDTIRELMDAGVTEPRQIARALNVSLSTIEADLAIIRKRYAKDAVEDAGGVAFAKCMRLREKSIGRLEAIGSRLFKEAIPNETTLDLPMARAVIEVEAAKADQVAGLEKLCGLSPDRVIAKVQAETKTQVTLDVEADTPITLDQAAQLLVDLTPDPRMDEGEETVEKAAEAQEEVVSDGDVGPDPEADRGGDGS